MRGGSTGTKERGVNAIECHYWRALNKRNSDSALPIPRMAVKGQFVHLKIPTASAAGPVEQQQRKTTAAATGSISAHNIVIDTGYFLLDCRIGTGGTNQQRHKPTVC